MATPDEHIVELTQLVKHFEGSAKHYDDRSPIAQIYKRRAEAIRWVLSLNAYGVDESEVVI